MQKIFSTYLSDPIIAECCGDASFIRKMLEVEMALASVQVQLGIIPKTAAREITSTLSELKIDPSSLSEGTLQNGIPVLPLLAYAKSRLSQEAADSLHWGATSQDIVDTAMVLIIKEVLIIVEERLQLIMESLKKLSAQHQQTPMVARTRTQQAVPITFGQKVNDWWQPLERHLKRLEEMKPRLFLVQLGGAGGNRSVLGDQSISCAHHLAKALGLHFSGTWHTQRDGLAEWASWMAMLSGSIGKMAQDILWLAQTEIGELAEQAGGGGQSSTMPHKNNPVLSEAIVALAKYNQQLATASFQSMFHQQERDGVAMALEWLTLPTMMITTGAILNHAITISHQLKVNTIAMQANLERFHGLVFSEKASLLLNPFMNRAEAKAVVGRACEIAVREQIHLAKALKKLRPDIELDWDSALQ